MDADRINKTICVRICVCSLLWLLAAFFMVPVSFAADDGGQGNAPAAYQSTDDGTLPVYHPPGQQLENRRREAGLSDTGNGSVNRGVSRGTSRGYARGVSRGTSRGYARGISRGQARGQARGIARGQARGVDPDQETVQDTDQGYQGYSGELSRMLVDDPSMKDADREGEIDSLPPLPEQMVPLAAAHTGLTTSSHPTLRFYISDPWPGDIEFALNVPRQKEPIIETVLAGPFTEGMHKIDLTAYNISLKPDVEYEWFIAISPDPEERSADFLGSATIKYVKPSKAFQERVSRFQADRLHFFYADQGYWYDTIDTVSRCIESTDQKDKTVFKTQRSALLKQVNLLRASAFDQK